jgi:hypothetical protein
LQAKSQLYGTICCKTCITFHDVPVHLVSILVHALQVVANLFQELLGVLRGEQSLAHHVLDQLGLLGQHQRGGLLRADLGDSLGAHGVQQVARHLHL